MSKVVKFEDLAKSDLFVDAIYQGGTKGNAGDDPISKLMRCGNQAGFRYTGSYKRFDFPFVVLYSSLDDPNWPDQLDLRTGIFTYYGDNKKPGHELHDTSRNGNLILRQCFELVALGRRNEVPPFFIFTKTGNRRDVRFRGLAVPGFTKSGHGESLVAIWKSDNGERFQNYRALFSILDNQVVKREWIDDLMNREKNSSHIPSAFKSWTLRGNYSNLIAQRSLSHRSKHEQIPATKQDKDIIETIYNHYLDPYEFEKCACEIVRMMDSNVVEIDQTRPWVDGGRDGTGKYRIGLNSSSIDVEFAVEAKRYGEKSGVGVKECSRLISRIRNRQFGVLVTTSYVHNQAYKEIVDDGHPIIIISGKDIARILKKNGITTMERVNNWIKSFEVQDG